MIHPAEPDANRIVPREAFAVAKQVPSTPTVGATFFACWRRLASVFAYGRLWAGIWLRATFSPAPARPAVEAVANDASISAGSGAA